MSGGESALRVVGAVGSPYTRKLRAALRYRQIPFRFVHAGSPESRDLPESRVALLPRLILPGADGALEARVDTTPLLRELERTHPGRSLLPDDPAIAWIDALLEDFADEWLTKAMFHYRWAYPPDVAKAAAILPRWHRPDVPEAELRAMGDAIAKRQIARLEVVGSNPTTAPVIEASYRRLLQQLDARLAASRFLLGSRPATADFAFYGQLTQLAEFDPTPAALALEIAPRVVAWTGLLEDVSGVEPGADGWLAREALREALAGLLSEVGRVYVPYLLANAAALDQGAERVECRLDGMPWVQKPFPYQGRCLEVLRERHAELGSEDRRAVAEIVAGSGCEPLLSPA